MNLRLPVFLTQLLHLRLTTAEPHLQHPLLDPILNPLSIPPTFAPNMTRRAPVISISHGGGPMPILGDPSHAAIVKSLKTRVPELLKLGTPEAPRAIVVVTAHWSGGVPTISGGRKHGLLYDYYGFPKEAYSLKYEAEGSPEVAAEVQAALKVEGLEGKMDGQRGWDHGVFIPMLLINPVANIPIVQLSVLSSESPNEHYLMGRALSSLRDSNIAIVGSGFASLHNLRVMFSGALSESAFKTRNKAFSAKVAEAVGEIDVEERGEKFESWREWPSSYEMHPKGGAEHFMPLIVCAGAGGEGEAGKWKDEFMGVDFWSFYWE